MSSALLYSVFLMAQGDLLQKCTSSSEALYLRKMKEKSRAVRSSVFEFTNILSEWVIIPEEDSIIYKLQLLKGYAVLLYI